MYITSKWRFVGGQRRHEVHHIGFVFPDVIHHYQVLTPGVNKAAYLMASPFTIAKLYIPFQVNHLHGQTEPVPRRMRATLTETEPVLFDVNYQATAC